ncbi:MAG TPA: MFS transporter [Caulobacteraceae bacterium]|nr:MFS transporter [Caulobacteraceae bacterium]
MVSNTIGKPGRGSADQAETLDGGATDLRIIRRVAFRFIPFLMACYVIAWLNRVNLSFAALQMNKDLGLTQTAYGLGAGLFFVTYCLCEIPSNLLLHKFGASRWIARIMLSWGVLAVATAFIRGPMSFYVMRLLLGAAEAGFYPGVLYFFTLWFPAAYRGRIIGLFLASIPITGIIGAPLSGWLLTLDGLGGLRGWQWLYIVEGLPAILLAPLVVFLIQDTPAKAKWLPEADRLRLENILSLEKRSVDNKRAYTVLQALANPWVLFLAVTYFSNVCMMNGITFFLPQIVKGFGYSNVQTGFVVAIPSVLAFIVLIWWGRRSDARKERYGHAAMANMAGALALMAAMLLHDPAARIAAISVSYAFTLAFTAPFWAIPGSFLTGASAAGGIAAISGLGVLGGVVTPWAIGHIHDLTGDFRVGLGLDACLGMAVTVAFYLLGRRRGASL